MPVSVLGLKENYTENNKINVWADAKWKIRKAIALRSENMKFYSDDYHTVVAKNREEAIKFFIDQELTDEEGGVEHERY